MVREDPMRILLLSLIAACSGDKTDPSGTPTGTPSTGAAAGTPSTGTPSTGTPTGSTTSADCANLPAGPLTATTLTGLHAGEDFDFDGSGHLIAHSSTSLFRQEYPPGSITPFATTDGGPGGPASLRLLPSGDLVYANVDTATLYRVDPAGGTTVVDASLGYPTGLDIHSSGLVFLADLAGIKRIDPYALTAEIVVPPGNPSGPNGLTFSADYSTLYVGTYNQVYAIPVDADGTPTSPPTLFADSPGGVELLGMGVDACDNLYAIRGGNTVVRWAPTGGDPELVVEVAPGAAMTNLGWGRGHGGWEADRLYVNDRFGNQLYYEVPVEVGAKPRP